MPFCNEILRPCRSFSFEMEDIFETKPHSRNLFLPEWHHGEGVSVGSKSEGKAIPLQAWTSPEYSRSLSFPDFKAIGKVRW